MNFSPPPAFKDLGQPCPKEGAEWQGNILRWKGVEEPAFSLQVPSGAAEGPARTLSGRAKSHTDTHAQAGAPVRTHLGGRLSEQRSVVQATGAVGPGREVLHFGVSSLSPSHSKLASIPSRSLKFGAPHAAWSPGTHSSSTRASGKSGRRRWVGAQTRGSRPLRLSPALLLILSNCLRK